MYIFYFIALKYKIHMQLRVCSSCALDMAAN